jgi:hypothetical protein
MKFNISPWHFEELIKKSYSLDHIFLLSLINENNDISTLCENSMKIQGMEQSLIRKGLITEQGAITTLGKELLVFINSKEEKKIVKAKSSSTDFDIWYKTYPGTNQFTYKGKLFEGNRGLRIKPSDCRIAYDKIILAGVYTAEQLLKALEYEILQRKESSFKERKNNLTFMQSSIAYLNSSSFQGFIELIEQGASVKESESLDSTNI